MIRWTKDRVVVELLDHSKTKTGLIIPDEVLPKMRTGRVLGAGSEAKGIKIGDIVYFLRWVGNPIYVENKDAIYLSAYHIIGFPD